MTMTHGFIVMKRINTLHLLFISGFCTIALGSSNFHLITQQETFSDAKTYCREMYSDLASVHNTTDMNNLITLISNSVVRAWIGLENGRVWKWHWSRPDQELDFLNWREGEPQNTDVDACGVMDQKGEWFESQCETRRSFVCQGNFDTGGHIFVPDTKSWRDAQNHCRNLSTELVSIPSLEENELVRNISESQDVWIGLFKDPWTWSDGSNTSFRFWKPSQPNYFNGEQDCVVSVFRDEGKWNDFKCSGQRAFVCRGASKMIPLTTTEQSTQLSQTTKGLSVNMTTLQDSTTSQHTMVTSSNQSHVTRATTEEKATTVQPHTTSAMLSTSSTNFNSAATEMSNISATQHQHSNAVQATAGNVTETTGNVSAITAQIPPITTAHVTTVSFPGSLHNVSSTATQMGASAETSTHITSTALSKPTGYSHNIPQGNLILIKKNLTWIEAMAYCRTHYVDLVHITTAYIQEEVAEKLKNAASLHVWLGLRYTCNFKFWFWTSSSSGCYQNWAPSQGPEREYDCEVSGAIEATGGQQWVGLPQTEKLNFICSTCAG